MKTLCIENLSKIYPDGAPALSDIGFEVSDGLFGLLGPNGAGKTTLMSIMTLLLEPTTGRYRLDGFDSRKQPQEIRRRLGYLPQNFQVFPELTAREFLVFLGNLRGLSKGESQSQAELLLDRVRLQNVQHKRLKTYSGGMLRRVGVAQALLGNPRLIIVDEPTASLDPEERVHLRNLLFELGEQRIIVLSTHIVKDIEETCSQMALLLDGRIHYQGSPIRFVQKAAGATWEFTGPAEALDHWSARAELVAVREEPEGLRFRVVSQNAPHEDAQLVTPNLEDAYVHFLAQPAAA